MTYVPAYTRSLPTTTPRSFTSLVPVPDVAVSGAEADIYGLAVLLSDTAVLTPWKNGRGAQYSNVQQ